MIYQNALGMIEGVERDHPRAAKLYEKACEMGTPSSCDLAGALYRDGGDELFTGGLKKDPARAATLYERGCQLDWEPSCAAFERLKLE
jgi:TPR repeat protein